MKTFYFAVHDRDGAWGGIRIDAEDEAAANAKIRPWIDCEDDPVFDSLGEHYTLAPLYVVERGCDAVSASESREC